MSRIYTFCEYQDETRSTAIYPEAGQETLAAQTYCALKLAGEAGEVAEKLAKLKYRLDPLDLTNFNREQYTREVIKKELGDVLWYIARLCTEFNLSLEDVANANLQKLSGRAERGTIKGSGDDR